MKRIPKFKSEDQERNFWAKADTSQYFDFSRARRVIFPNLKPTKHPISIRLSQSLLAKVKAVANKKDLPYQSLLKQYITQATDKDFQILAG